MGKDFLKNPVVIIGITGAVVIAGVLFFLQTKSAGTLSEPVADVKNTPLVTASDDFQRMGEKSFGLSVCDDMPKEEVGNVLGKAVSKTRDYSNNTSTGCEYYIQDQHFVIVDVGYGDMENQRKGLQVLERRLGEEARIGLPNFLSYSERGLIDVYMNVAEKQKFVRVGRSSTTATTEEDLIALAIAVEKKIRSFK